jgi:hypothetical protein
MQEEFKNKLKRTAKKLAAIGTGALVAGSTMVGAALAADLSGLPAPFITSGAFDAYIVIGTSAATITAATLQDIQGSIELATALGQLATTSAGAEGSATLSLRQFTGENLAGMYVDTSVANTYHENAGGSWGDLGASSTLVALDDVVFTRSDSSVYNSTIALDLDDDYVEFNRDDLSVHVNASTDSVNVFTVTLGTNRTNTNVNGFNEGDSLNWFGTLYEVVDVLTDGNISLGSTSEVAANKGESFTIGGASFTFESVASSGTQVSILDASGARHFVNSTYSTIGNIQLRIKTGTVFSSDVITTATFETVENAYKFALGDAWPLDTDFVVESMTVDTTNAIVNSTIVLRNNRTYDLSAKGAEVEIASGLNFIYSDNAADETTAAYGTSGIVNITETAGVSLILNGTESDGVGTPIYNWPVVALTLPGVNFVRVSGSSTPTVTSLTNSDSFVLYAVDNSTSKYEFYANLTAASDSVNVTWARPLTEGSIVYGSIPTSGAWTSESATGTYTTPSGVVLNDSLDYIADGANTTLILKVAAVQIDIDASTYYGRKGASWADPKYSAYDQKINWVASTSTTGTVTVSEPTGKTLTAVVTFQDDDDSVFAKAADITFGGTVLTAPHLDSDLDTDFGSKVVYISNGTYNQSVTDPIEASVPGVDDKLVISSPRKDIVIGVGALQDVEVTLDTDDSTSTPVNSTIGNTTVTLSSGSGSSVSVNKISPGFSKLDSEITASTLAKPVILMGGSGINGLVKNLRDGGLYDPADLTAQGEGHAKVAFVENAFNSQTALVIAGYSGPDTLMASRAIASALLNGQPFSFADQASANLVLNTGTSVVNDVSVMS